LSLVVFENLVVIGKFVPFVGDNDIASQSCLPSTNFSDELSFECLTKKFEKEGKH